MKVSLLIAACLAVSTLGQDEPPTPPPPPMRMEMEYLFEENGAMNESGPWDKLVTPGVDEAPSDDWMHMGSGSEERFEGDMVLTDEQLRQLNGTDGERNGLVDTRYRWSQGVVPYILSSSFSASEKSVIRRAMDDYQQKTCITFVERSNQRDYLSIIKSSGCWSYVGRRGGSQQLSLGNGCVYHYIAQHELMHAVGFFHEQSRCDRDDYVTILTQNIQSGRENNFNKYTCSQVTAFGQPYDYVSVMHYSKYAFSRNGQPTIQAKDNPSRTLGNNVGLSTIDVKKLNAMYGCSTTSGTSSTTTTTTTTTVAPAGSCRDVFTASNQCAYWANTMNLCSSSTFRTWMMTYCRESCDNCSPCVDRSARACSRYNDRGYCTGRPNLVMFMASYCPSTCGYCQASTTECEDIYTASTQCPNWASRGYCATSSRYHTFMKFNCRKSCDSTLQTCSACEDYSTSYCSARTSYCGDDISTSMGRIMAAYCRKTCGDCT